VNQSIAVVTCPRCDRRFVVDVDDLPVETGAATPVCSRCARGGGDT
jgi:hypothetical protein